MSHHEPLRGSCSCGRNQYLIRIPEDVTAHARIYFDSSWDNRRSQGTPITAWLQVPLGWYESYTQAYFPDETHASIRRTFTPYHSPHTKRNFCGFCGTHLTYWTEEPREEADLMSVSVASLLGDGQSLLEELDLLPEELSDGVLRTEHMTANQEAGRHSSTVAMQSDPGSPGLLMAARHGIGGGIPWFEEMIEGSRLGRLLQSRRGVAISDDQKTRVEWRISDWHEDTDPANVRSDLTTSGHTIGHAIGKRKRG
ncbi:hypothetical protein ASPZODRAFT_133533 [Penicilliopsis zonata CBS 506.65]|uniref:CENP-V/GFA domain-containing protein n=1 Tax=Penicilliopsis zonata CBS 506.65 TaxID=1073090 RepID=A0A1L9SEN5_9EURO|nr:hypothetical protein ASPZODRAFT_133533 [Penicilliopsis zonata CBS 506.65]OJJ45666.1 hypothetical protein ASPZODRAFT_133533 [Penicilliopsis zonata CBS 506.65]